MTISDQLYFDVAVGGTNLVKLYHGETEVVHLSYSGFKEDVRVTGELDSGTTLPTHHVKVGNDTIDFPVNSADLQKEGLGTYLLTFNLRGKKSGRQAKKEIIVFHEEPIRGFKVRAFY